MRTIMQRCEQCGQWIDITVDDNGQSVICVCGYINIVKNDERKINKNGELEL